MDEEDIIVYPYRIMDWWMCCDIRPQIYKTVGINYPSFFIYLTIYNYENHYNGTTKRKTEQED